MSTERFRQGNELHRQAAVRFRPGFESQKSSAETAGWLVGYSPVSIHAGGWVAWPWRRSTFWQLLFYESIDDQ
jgi:hypothetical protein